MELLAAAGRTEAALAQFETCREMLRQALDVEPETQTRELARAIRAARNHGQKPQAAPTLTVLGTAGEREDRFETLEEALDAGLDGLSDDRQARGVVTLGPPPPGIVQALPDAGLFLPTELARRFGADSKFTLARLDGVPGLRQVSDMPRNRMMISATTTAPSRRLEEVLSVAVLPFREVSPEAAEVSLGVVLAEEVAARLARFAHLTVASPSAAVTCRALDLSADEIHARLGVAYAVDGSVFRVRDDLRLSMTITDLATGRVAAADRFEGTFAEIFERQSDLVDRIASTISKQTEASELAKVERALTEDIGAYEWYLRAVAAYRRAGLDLSYARQAVDAFDAAFALDDAFMRARALRACSISWYDQSYVESGDALRDMQKAVTVRDDDPEVHRIVGALSMMSGDYEAGLAHAQRAVEMNPADAYLLGQSAIYWSWYGEPDKALPIMDRALLLDPFLPVWAVEDHGVILYSKGEYEAAIASLTRLPVRQPRGMAFRAASQVALGDVDGARATVRELLRHRPDYTAEQLGWVTFYREAENNRALFARLEQAGLP
jgi:TolB-like protein/Flp pilus assembly protein TadD